MNKIHLNKIIYKYIMEYQLKLLKIFDNEGFSKVVDLLDELINNEELLLNFLILNMNNTNNIKYLCNFLKKIYKI